MMTGGITTIYIAQNCDFGNIFMKTPRVLIEEEMFAILDNHDRMAYTVMLDRAVLCAGNGWVDSEGRVYIYFTVEEACRVLKLGRTKVAKIFRTLMKVGLIERVRQGLGRPAIIYVKAIYVDEENETDYDVIPDAPESNNVQKTVSNEITDEQTRCNPAEIHRRPHGECLDDREKAISDQIVDNSARRPSNECHENIRRPLGGSLEDHEKVVKASEIHRRPHSECQVNRGTVRRPSGECLDDRKTVIDKIDIDNNNNKNIININHINQSISVKKNNKADRIMIDDPDADCLRQNIKNLIRKHIGYNDFEDFRPDDLPMVDEIVELMTDVITTDDSEIMISRIPRNGDLVRQRFMLMKSDVVEYVIDSVKRVQTRIRNMRHYLLTALYNAPDTIENYYRSIFRSSMSSRAGYGEAAYG